MQSGINYHVTDPMYWRTIMQNAVKYPLPHSKPRDAVYTWDYREIFQGSSITDTKAMLDAWQHPESISPEDLRIMYHNHHIHRTDQLMVEGVYAHK